MDSFAQEATVSERVKAFPERQALLLQQIAGAVENSTLEQSIALTLSEQYGSSTHAAFAAYSSQTVTGLEFSVLLRVLHRSLQDPGMLNDEAKKNLVDQLGQVVRSGAPWLFQPVVDLEASESEEFLRLSNLFLWSLYLQQSQFPFEWPDRKNHAEHVSHYKQGTQALLQAKALQGFAERSSGYYRLAIASLCNLRDFGGNDAVTVFCDGLLDVLLLDIAQQSLDQAWGGVHNKTFEIMAPLDEGRLQTLFFDLPEPIAPQTQLDWTLYHAGNTQYLPPEVALRVGSDRRERGSFEVRNRYAVQEPGRQVQEQYAYVTPEFVLGSYSLYNEAVPPQSRPWDLMVWDEQKGENHLFSFLGGQMFSGGRNAEEENFLWNATVMQHKNVLFGQYHRSDRKRAGQRGEGERMDRHYIRQPARIWISDAFSPVTEEDGWWFCDTGRVYIAFRPLEGSAYWWRTAETGDPMDGGAAILSLLNLETGLLLEVDESARFSSFNQFKNQVKSSPLKVDEDFVTYVSRRGDVLLFPRKTGDFLVNGRPSETQTRHQTGDLFDLYSSPYLRSQFGSGIYISEWTPYALRLDLSDGSAPKRILTPPR